MFRGFKVPLLSQFKVIKLVSRYMYINDIICHNSALYLVADFEYFPIGAHL